MRNNMQIVLMACMTLATPALSQVPIPTTPAPLTVTPVVGPQPIAVAPTDALDGQRMSKIIGATVYGEQDVKIGSVDDLVVRLDEKVSVAVLSVGGFLGVGSKLVSVPFSDLRIVGGKVTLPAANKAKLTALPSFSYAQ